MVWGRGREVSGMGEREEGEWEGGGRQVIYGSCTCITYCHKSVPTILVKLQW